MAEFILPRDDPEDRHEFEEWVGRLGNMPVGRAPAAHMLSMGFEVLTDEVLGEGFFGKVFRAKVANAAAACKVQPSNSTSQREVELLRNLISHTNIVQVFGIFESHPDYRNEGKVYIFMELLATDLRQYSIDKYGLVETEAKFLFKQIASGLEYLHLKGWAHRDIKADNVLLDSSHTLAKLTDFSLTCRVIYTDSRRTRSASHLEFLSLINPDWRQRSPSQGSDPQLNDVYEMGKTLFFMIEARDTFDEDDDDEDKVNVFIRDISETCKDFVNYLMTQADDERPSISQALEHPWIARLQVVAGRPRGISQISRRTYSGSSSGSSRSRAPSLGISRPLFESGPSYPIRSRAESLGFNPYLVESGATRPRAASLALIRTLFGSPSRARQGHHRSRDSDVNL